MDREGFIICTFSSNRRLINSLLRKCAFGDSEIFSVGLPYRPNELADLVCLPCYQILSMPEVFPLLGLSKQIDQNIIKTKN